MANDVEIHIRVKDDSAAGARSAKKSGEKAGKDYGDGVADGIGKSSGKQRDAMGRFSKGAEDEAGKGGDRAGKNWSSRFSAWMKKGDHDDAKGLAQKILGSLKSTLGAGQPLAMTLGTAFSTQFLGSVVSGLASGAGKVAHGLGASLALLPAILATAGLGMATFKVALSGVGDALKAGLTGDAEEFRESLKGLAPEARTFARGVRSLKGEIKDLKQHVQGQFFAPFAKSIRPLGETYLPILKQAMGGVASSFGQVGKQFAGWAQQPVTVVKIAGALGHMRTSLGDVASGVMGLVRAFLPLITVGSTFLPGLTGGFKGATENLARFMEEAEKTGKLKKWISDGLSKIGDLVDTGQQLWRIFKNIGDVGKEVFQGLGFKSGGLLDKLEALTQKARDFFQTAEGGEVAATIFETLRAVLSSLTGTLSALAVGFAKMFGPLLPMIAQFLEAFATFKVSLIAALMPVAAIITATILPPLTKLLEFINGNRAALVAVTGVVVAFAAWAAGSAISTAKTVANLVTLNGNLGSTVKKIKDMGTAAQVASGAAAIGALVYGIYQMNEAIHAARIRELTADFLATGKAGAEFKKALDVKPYIEDLNNLTKVVEGGAHQFSDFHDVVKELAATNLTAARGYIDLAEAEGIASEEIDKARSTVKDMAADQSRMEAATHNAKSAMEKETEAISAFTSEVDKLLGKALAVPEAQAAFTEAIAASTEELIGQRQEFGANAASMDVNTVAGARNIEMIGGLIRKGADVISAMREQGATGAELRAEQQRQIEQINGVAQSLGLEQGAVNRLTAALTAIPAQVTSHIGVAGKEQSIGDIGRIQEAINNLRGRDVNIRIVGRSVGVAIPGGGMYAHGGVRGSAAGGGPRGRQTLVGEQGPEIVDLAPGSTVHSNPDSQRMMANSGGGGGELEITIGHTGDALIDAILDSLRFRIKNRFGGDSGRALSWSR